MHNQLAMKTDMSSGSTDTYRHCFQNACVSEMHANACLRWCTALRTCRHPSSHGVLCTTSGHNIRLDLAVYMECHAYAYMYIQDFTPLHNPLQLRAPLVQDVHSICGVSASGNIDAFF